MQHTDQTEEAVAKVPMSDAGNTVGVSTRHKHATPGPGPLGCGSYSTGVDPGGPGGQQRWIPGELGSSQGWIQQSRGPAPLPGTEDVFVFSKTQGHRLVPDASASLFNIFANQTPPPKEELDP